MLVGYVGTAGIAVVIITLLYFLAYDPQKDPFKKENASIFTSTSITHRPNPVDIRMLALSRVVGHRLSKLLPLKAQIPFERFDGQRLEFQSLKVWSRKHIVPLISNQLSNKIFLVQFLGASR